MFLNACNMISVMITVFLFRKKSMNKVTLTVTLQEGATKLYKIEKN